MSTSKVVVVDNGTGVAKAGFAGDALPRLVFPCVVGRDSLPSSKPSPVVAVGNEALSSDPPLYLSYPLSNGVVTRWDDMCSTWDYTWSNLQVDPTESRVMLTQPALNPTLNKQKMVEIMLEQYGFQGVAMQVQAILSLYAHGMTTGVVLDCGDGVSHAVGVVDGHIFPHLTRRLDLAGRHITDHLLEMLVRSGAPLHRGHDFEVVRKIKESCCYVAMDTQREMQLAKETTCLTKAYTLPDGRVIKVGPERFQAAEALFNPSLMDKEQPGIAKMVWSVTQEADIDCRRRLLDSIVLSGGTTLLPGLTTRLERELKQLYLTHTLKGDTSRLPNLSLTVHDSPDRAHLVFRGAAVLAQLMEDEPSQWVTREQWEEDPYRALQCLEQTA